MATPSQEKAPEPSKRGSYEALRECHKRAYAYLTEALQIDEAGQQGKGLVKVFFDHSHFHIS